MRLLRRASLVCLLGLALIAGLLYLAWTPVELPLAMQSIGMRSWDWQPATPADPQHLKVVTYNIGYASGRKNNQGDVLSRAEVEANLQSIATALRTLNPDIVGLQEVDFQSARTFDVDQLAYVAQALGLPHAAYVINWNHRYVPWPYWPVRRQFGQIVSGQAVLSRYPIRAQRVIKHAKPRENTFWYNWFYLDRASQRVEIDVAGERVIVWHTHLEAFKSQARRRQAERLANETRSDLSPLQLVLGDFNSISQVKPGVTIDEDREAVTIVMHAGRLHNAEFPSDAYSFPSWEPIKKIDHIFSRPPLRAVRYGIAVNTLGSDHLPVWAYFKLP